MLLRQGERCLVAKGFLFLFRKWWGLGAMGLVLEMRMEGKIYTIDRSDE
jgi:hypothetical protein